jgi:hypothetical protein
VARVKKPSVDRVEIAVVATLGVGVVVVVVVTSVCRQASKCVGDVGE